MAVVIGGLATFYGFDSIIGFNWEVSEQKVRYADPPIIQIKKNKKVNQSERFGIKEEKNLIYCYTYEDFLEKVNEIGESTLDVEVQKNLNLGDSFVIKAVAQNSDYCVSYEPSLLIAITDYGNDDLISEIETEGDNNYLRIISPFEEYSSFLSDIFRKKRLPYALNLNNLDTDNEIDKALTETYYPKFLLKVTNKVIEFPVSLSYEEVQLKMKGLIYDAVIRSYKSGHQMIVFKANIKNLKCLQTTLEEMLPLPVKILSYPLWSSEI